MVLQGIKDGLDIREKQHNHQSHSMTIMYSFFLALDLLESFVLMFSSVISIAFLAETPHTVDVVHVLFAITQYKLKEAMWKVLSVATGVLMCMRRKSLQGRNFSQADQYRPGQLPT